MPTMILTEKKIEYDCGCTYTVRLDDLNLFHSMDVDWWCEEHDPTVKADEDGEEESDESSN